MAREVNNNTDLAMNLVSKERPAQKAEAAVGSAQEGQRHALTRAGQAERRSEEAEGMAGDAESRTRDAVVKASQLESKLKQAEKLGQVAVDNLRDMEKRAGEAESKAGRLEIKLSAASKLSEDIRTETQRLFTRAESAEAMTRRVKVEAEEDLVAARSDVSAPRTGAYLQNSQVACIEAQAKEHENEQASLREMVEELEDCVLCLDKPKTMCLLPCSHVCICESCAGESWTDPCPICRASVTSQRRVFVAGRTFASRVKRINDL
jgi:chromosome segregation ATPase